MPDGISDALANSRTVLANERTFAAWIRTGLAVAGTGLAVARAAPESERRNVASVLGVAFVALGASLLFLGSYRYVQVNAELREVEKPPVPFESWATYASSRCSHCSCLAHSPCSGAR